MKRGRINHIDGHSMLYAYVINGNICVKSLNLFSSSFLLALIHYLNCNILVFVVFSCVYCTTNINVFEMNGRINKFVCACVCSFYTKNHFCKQILCVSSRFLIGIAISKRCFWDKFSKRMEYDDEIDILR